MWLTFSFGFGYSDNKGGGSAYEKGMESRNFVLCSTLKYFGCNDVGIFQKSKGCIG